MVQTASTTTLVAPAPATPPRTGRAKTLTAVGLVALLAVGSTAGAHELAERRSAEQLAQAQVAARVAEVVQAAAHDARFAATVDAAMRTAAGAALRGEAVTTANAALAAADGALGAHQHADDAARTALQTARDQVATAVPLVGAGTSVATLRTALVHLDGTQQATAAQEQAWQQAEAARQAEAQRQAQAAREAQARRATASPARPATGGTQGGTQGGATGGSPSQPAAAAQPAGGPKGHTLTCVAGGSASSSVFDAGSVGAAINAYRAQNGLSQLSVSSSGSLVGHAQDMAAWGQIWHSGGDNIVGCQRPASAASLVGAWSRSPSHDRQMRRTDVTSMRVGATLADGILYAAVLFR